MIFLKTSTRHRFSFIFFPKLKARYLFSRHFVQNRIFAIPNSQFPALLHNPSIIPCQESSGGASDSPSGIASRVFSLVCHLYCEGDRTLSSLQIDVSIDQAIAVVDLLARREGSMATLGFFRWAIARTDFRHSMRFFIATAGSLLAVGNFDKAQEVMRSMVECFAAVGRLKEAVDMVFEMQNQGLPLSIHTLNRILRIAADSGMIELAYHVFDEMPLNQVSPDLLSFKTMIIVCCREGLVGDVERFLTAMEERGFCIDNATCTLAIDAYCKKGLFNKIHGLFEKMNLMGFSPNVINYTALINGLCKKGSVKQAFQVLEEMVAKGMKPNVYTHTALIDGLCKIGWTERAFRLFLKLVRSFSYKPNVKTYTAMISGYCKEGKLNRAEMLLSKMREQELFPNTNTYATLIDGHCKLGNLDRAFELFDELKKSCIPNIFVYNTLMDGLFKKGRAQKAHKLLQEGVEQGLKLDRVTYTILIGEHCRRGRISQALELFDGVVGDGCNADIQTYTTLITACCRQRKMVESEKLLNDCIKLGLKLTKQTFTSMICGYCRDGKANSALRVFEKMIREGCVPDSVTYGAIISGLCKEARLEEARALYESMLDKGLVPCEVTRIALAYEFCKREKIGVAVLMLERLEENHWTQAAKILVRKLSSVGNMDAAATFLNKLLDVGYNVDGITYTAFFSGCYENGRYSLASSLSERISKEIVIFKAYNGGDVT
ncbi:Pentatricopeptide repeat-containing protein [Apostasia shenzhenica]|uniref:Pentatricopeptide repeat-containing protein n=1 Tax=Apostasia shenzhenica TaxID=1088818 RepID=A0A2I0A1W4_9ASPA|nr:Pentatricopeptide repeat-containing protein [Apostasia shenzhenica]